jgi:hypothetical protein
MTILKTIKKLHVKWMKNLKSFKSNYKKIANKASQRDVFYAPAGRR